MQTAWLLVVYLVIVLIGEAIVVALGLMVLDKKYPSLSVPVSVFLYLAVFVFGWKLAIRLTEPKRTLQQ
jgi:flagellar biosynthesis protein FliP